MTMVTVWRGLRHNTRSAGGDSNPGSAFQTAAEFGRARPETSEASMLLANVKNRGETIQRFTYPLTVYPLIPKIFKVQSPTVIPGRGS